MKKRAIALLALLLTGLTMGVTKVIVTGEAFYMGGTGDDPINQRSTVLDLRAWATLCVTNFSEFWRIWGHASARTARHSSRAWSPAARWSSVAA